MPLLERTAMDIALQAARFADPRYPALRLQPSIPVLHFYLRSVWGGGGVGQGWLAKPVVVARE